MSVDARLKKIEAQLNKSNIKNIFRLVGCDGSYPEHENDMQRNIKVIKVMVDGVSCEELRSWAV